MAQPSFIRGPNPTFLAAAVSSALCWWLSQDPLASPEAVRVELARKFSFARHALPEVPGPAPRTVRPVAPSLARIDQWVSSLTSGATLADLDADGLPNELLFTDTRTEQLIVTPVPGSSDRFKPFQLLAFGHDRATAGPSGSMVLDYNEDGWADILVTFSGRTPLLFRRKPAKGKKGLTAADFVPEEIVPAGRREAWTTSAVVQTDLDGDGHLDLVFGNYFPNWCNLYDPNETRVQEMHNNNGWACNGGGVQFYLWQQATAASPSWFREVENLLPDKVLHGWTLAIGAQDLDGDLLPDLYIGNDLGPDRLLWNRSTPGKLAFEVVEGRTSISIPGSFVIGQDKYKGMSCDFADVNGDGSADIFVSNLACVFALQESHFLWLSDLKQSSAGGRIPTYVQASEALGLSRGGWGWDAKFESFTNQITPDLIQMRGFIQGKISRWPEMQSLASYNSVFLKEPRNWPTFRPGMDIAGTDRNALYTMGPDGRYHDVGAMVGLDEAMVSRAVATADVDGDGRMDFSIANMWKPGYFFQNRSPAVGRFLGLRLLLPERGAATDGPVKVLEGRPPNRGRPAYGAVASVTLPCGRVLKREVDGGNGHAGRRSPELHFGLGELEKGADVLSVKVRWRDAAGKVAGPAEIKVKPDTWTTVILGTGRSGEVAR